MCDVTKIIYSNRCDHSQIINKHGDFFYFTHEYGLYPIVTNQLLAAFDCLKCTKGGVVAEVQKLIGPSYRGDYVVVVIKRKRTDVVTYPILLVKVKFSVAGYINNVNSSDITEMFLYVKYIFEEHQNVNTIYCVLTDGMVQLDMDFSSNLSEESCRLRIISNCQITTSAPL